MTSRHRRSALPLLTALLIGAAVAGAATVMAKPFDPPASGQVGLGATLAPSPDAAEGAPLGRASSPQDDDRPVPVSPPSSTPTTQPPPPATTTTTEPPAPPSSRQPTSRPPQNPSATDRVVALVNEARAAAACPPLRVDEKLITAAQSHSEDMSKRDYFDHSTPDGVTFDVRIKNTGFAKPGAENIAKDLRSAEEVMAAWMESKGHRTNILNCSLTAIGVGLETDGWYWTQDFGF